VIGAKLKGKDTSSQVVIHTAADQAEKENLLI